MIDEVDFILKLAFFWELAIIILILIKIWEVIA